MTTLITPAGYDLLAPRSSGLFHWDPTRPRLDLRKEMLATVAITGQLGTFTRDATATAKDSRCESYTVPYGFPAWDYADGIPGLAHGGDGTAAEYLEFAISFPPQAFTLLYRLRQSDDAVTAASTLLSIGLAAEDEGPGWRIGIGSDGKYSVTRRGGDSDVVVQTLDDVEAGSRLYLLLQVDAEGAQNFAMYDDELEPVDADGSTEPAALPPAWEDDVLRIGSLDTTAVERHVSELLKIWPGIHTLEEMLELF